MYIKDLNATNMSVWTHILCLSLRMNNITKAEHLTFHVVLVTFNLRWEVLLNGIYTNNLF